MKKNASRSRLKLQQLDRSFLDQGFCSLAGVDEAGRGPLAGPVVAAAVVVREFLFEVPINDSKAMTAAARELAYREILERCAVGVSIVEHEVIDQINILQATLRAMQGAVSRLPVPPDCLLVDGNKSPRVACKCFPIVDGDSKSLSIACASIVAKVTRDRIMEEYGRMFPQYGFSRHKGYGTSEHYDALEKHGPSPIHRKTFRLTRSVRGN